MLASPTRMAPVNRFVSLSVAVLLVGCAGQQQARNAAPEQAISVPSVPAQTLGSNDVFEVRVVGEQELTGAYRVASDGAITFPFCGKVAVAGHTATEVSVQLTTCLADGYLKNPQVTVFIKEANSKKVFVLGEVQKPGTFAYEDDMSVIQAITLAGGFTKLAARNSVLVTRTVDGKEQRVKIPVDDITSGKRENFHLQPGDIVFVAESFF